MFSECGQSLDYITIVSESKIAKGWKALQRNEGIANYDVRFACCAGYVWKAFARKETCTSD